MKKLLAFLLALIMVLALAGCGMGGSRDPFDGPQDNDEEDALSYSFSRFGEGKLTIVGAEFSKDEDGEDFLRIYYDYTNTSDSAADQFPYYALRFEATQNGEELEDMYFYYADEEGAVAEDMFTDCGVLPGVTLRQTILFYCSPDDGVIDISCYLLIGSWLYSEDTLERFDFQIDPDNLMGAPDPITYPPITNPTYAANLGTSASFDLAVPFSVSINGYELTTWDGMPALRVKMTYTNLDDGEWMPCVVLPINAYQDGISLIMESTWYLDDVTDADEAFEEYLDPGESVECNAIFILRTNSPVEVVVEDSAAEERVGIICTVE